MNSGVPTDNNQTGLYNRPVEVDSYVTRANTRKNVQLRDNVIYDVQKDKKEGMIVAFNANSVSVLQKNTSRIDERDIRDLFKVDELIGSGHWDYFSNTDRVELLKDARLPVEYFEQDWSGMADNAKILIGKAAETAAATTSVKPDTSYSSTYGVSIRNPKSRQDKTQPGNDATNESAPSPAEHVVNTGGKHA